MNQRPSILRYWIGSAAIAASAIVAPSAQAQCNTCPTATVAYSPVTYQSAVAYQPVAYQPVVAYQQRDRWYPGRLFDRMRLRRWSRSAAVQPAYTAAYSPYTAAYSPYIASPYTAAYRPYLTSYAPLSRPVLQTSYQPITTIDSCTGCTQTTYRPVIQTVARPVLLRPLTACCSPCSPCSSCSSGVTQAIYSDSSPACSSCATTSSTPIYTDNASVGPATPRPTLLPDEAAPAGSTYRTNRAETSSDADRSIQNGSGTVDPAPGPESNGNGASSLLRAPRPWDFDQQDRSASRVNRPSVEVRNAVYRKPIGQQSTPSQAELDAVGWQAVAR